LYRYYTPPQQKKALFVIWTLGTVFAVGVLLYLYIVLGNLFFGVLGVLVFLLALGALNFLLWGRVLTREARMPHFEVERGRSPADDSDRPTAGRRTF
jgi:hypothetical protein